MRETSASEPLSKHRKASGGIKTGVSLLLREKYGGNLLIGHARLAGDTAYGAVRLLKWLVDCNIAPHIPVWDKSARPDGTFSRADFVFDHDRNVYTCLLYTSPSPRDRTRSRMPSSA